MCEMQSGAAAECHSETIAINVVIATLLPLSQPFWCTLNVHTRGGGSIPDLYACQSSSSEGREIRRRRGGHCHQ